MGDVGHYLTVRLGVPISALLLAGLVAGCGGLVQPSSLRPPGHPLLEGIAARPGLAPVRPRPLRATPTDDPLATRAAIVRALDRTLGRRDLDDLGLAAEAFTPLGYAGRRASRSLGALRRASRPRRGAARPGDLLLLHSAPRAPDLCVVRARLAGGVLEAACVTRGRVRRARFDPAHPNDRRRAGRVVNTFLRPVAPGDMEGARLAGALLFEIRTLL